jgi:hypothetical protein
VSRVLSRRGAPIFAQAVRTWSVMPPRTTMRFAAGSYSEAVFPER